MNRVLIGFAESLAAIESAWCLRDAGYEVIAFTRSGQRPALGAARGVHLVELPSPEVDSEASVAALGTLIDSERPAAVLPLDDSAVWLCDQALGDGVALGDAEPTKTSGGGLGAVLALAGLGRALSGPTAALAGPTGPQALLALDKREQIMLADKAGLFVPPTTYPDEAPPGDGPWMVKSALAIVPRDGKLHRPAGAIATTAADVPGVAEKLGGPVIVQPLLEGVGEGVFGFAAGGELFGLSAHRRVRMMNPRGSGSSACRSIPVEPELVEPIRRFLAEANWHGIFMIELLRDAAGKPWFMELNGRTWGSMALARHRDLPYPEWAVRAALDPQWRPTPPAEAPHLLVRHLGREIVHLLAVLRGARGADAGRWPSRRATLLAMLRPRRGTRWYHARRGELRVLLRDTWATVAGQLRRGA